MRDRLRLALQPFVTTLVLVATTAVLWAARVPFWTGLVVILVVAAALIGWTATLYARRIRDLWRGGPHA